MHSLFHHVLPGLQLLRGANSAVKVKVTLGTFTRRTYPERPSVNGGQKYRGRCCEAGSVLIEEQERAHLVPRQDAAGPAGGFVYQAADLEAVQASRVNDITHV